MNFTDAWRHDETTETLWTNPDTDIALLAPHAGDIEFNTEFDAGQSFGRRVVPSLVVRRVRSMDSNETGSSLDAN